MTYKYPTLIVFAVEEDDSAVSIVDAARSRGLDARVVMLGI